MKKKQSNLDPKFIAEIKAKILKEKNKLEQELAGFATKNPHVTDDYDAEYPEYGDKNDDNAQEVERYTVRKPLEIALEKSLRDVNNALSRMEKGTYGICKYCDEPIGEKRLIARPNSSACVSCKKTLTNEV
ncbi:TraR/DksA family transcriptional regulator [Patescibacteria group bacterium]|nr:TraR/DksA family transcriptional regulator [Patescibacteria group bacterium]MBU1895854.1 TraR/DksA family transcriptional regulator [Patescibacteria group bacterium]